MANTYLTRTQVAGNRQTFTQSFWIKLSNTTDQGFIATFNDSNNYNYCYLDSSTKQLSLQWKKSGGVIAQLNTDRKLRDVSGWYNVIYAVDTTQATAANRIKLYINGVQETAFSTATYPSQNESIEVNDNGTTQYVGSIDGSQQYFNGIMSYVAQIDGTQELPGIFGETDSTTGEWEIKTSITPSVAWGNNGFLILKNGNSLTDESSNSNNFTLSGGTLTKTEDCPSNVFATLNTLTYQAASQSNSGTVQAYNGNTTWKSQGSNQWGTIFSTIAPSTGKWYSEVKVGAVGGGAIVGVVDVADARANSATEWYIGQSSTGQGYQNNGSASNGGASYGATYTTGDIIGCAMDLDNSKIYWSKNGTFQNSGVPTSGATGTGALTLTANTNYAFAVTGYNTTTMNCNFGNGHFGTTTVSSAGTNASGIGIFEYDVPAGYAGLSTKGLNL